MRLAISNIAWDVEEDSSVARLLNDSKIDAIDVAPGKYFPDPAKAKDDEIAKVKNWWAMNGIEITGMQALLFGTTGLNVFGSTASQQALLDHLRAVCRIGAGLGATRLVFGSPKNRDRTGLNDQEALEIAAQFFGKLGDIASQWGVKICLEPNPVCYGSNFMTTSLEAAQVVDVVSHPSIRMQLDTGAIQINNEDIEIFLEEYSSLVGHIHASEPALVPLGDCSTDHGAFCASIASYLPHHIVTVEMIATKNESHIDSIKRALNHAVRCYRLADRYNAIKFTHQ
jgi:sugar phosphate isomerase/epimerase